MKSIKNEFSILANYPVFTDEVVNHIREEGYRFESRVKSQSAEKYGPCHPWALVKDVCFNKKKSVRVCIRNDRIEIEINETMTGKNLDNLAFLYSYYKNGFGDAYDNMVDTVNNYR